MSTEGKQEKNPVKICDTTLRDGHQSSFATRMRMEDIEALAEGMDKAGFYAMEVWGGATFDVATRFLNEDPWEKPRILKRLMPNNKLQMLLRGQNLVGYRNYPDDVVRAFVHKAAEVGIDIFRVFDALNDARNFEASFKAIKEVDKHIQGVICYSLTERTMGGPIYNIDYYVDKALAIQDMGAHSLCIKDMAGLIAPFDAYELFRALKKALRIPVELHAHYTSGMASMSYLKAVEAGVDIIDTALAPFALRSSQPAIEPIVVALQGTPRDTGLDLAYLFKLGEQLEAIAPKYRHLLNTTKMSVIDTEVLLHQIPGGMTTNLVSQLREADALDRINEVYEELPKTRAELGYPPLVTPSSQIVGSQAVLNVLMGRYKMVTDQIKDYVYGLYGKPPAPIDPEVQKLVLKGSDRGEEPITCRPADTLEPELEKAKEAVKDISQDMEDVLIYALYPTTGLRFLRWKHGLEEAPPETKAKTLEDVKREDELIAKARAGELVEKVEKPAPAKGPGLRVYNVFVGDEYYQVEVEPAGGARAVTAPMSRPPAAAAPPPQAATPPAAKEPKAAPTGATAGAVAAPMPGLIIRYEVEVGQQVKAGDTVVILEAMKMESALPAPVDGTVQELRYKPGDRVAKDAVLVVIG